MRVVERSPERLDALREQRIDRTRRLDRQRRVKMNRLRKIVPRVGEHLRHRAETRRRRSRANRGSVVLFLQQRKDRVARLGHIRSGIGFLGMQDAAIEIEPLELRAEQDPVDLVVLAPRRDVGGVDRLQQRFDVRAPLCDRIGRVVREARVERVQTLVAAPDGKVRFAPVVELDGGRTKISRCERRLSSGREEEKKQDRE